MSYTKRTALILAFAAALSQNVLADETPGSCSTRCPAGDAMQWMFEMFRTALNVSGEVRVPDMPFEPLRQMQAGARQAKGSVIGALREGSQRVEEGLQGEQCDERK